MIRRLLVLSYATLACAALALLVQSKPASTTVRERYDDPAARREWEFDRLRDPVTGDIPKNMRARELAFAAQMDVRGYRSNAGAGYGADWAFSGPINAGGRAQSLGIDVANEDNLVVATAAGGIWRSTDAGASWIKASAPDQLQDCFSLVQDHRAGKTNTWYCGTGELLSTTFRRASYVTTPRWRTLDVGNGIYKSTDNGVSWSLLASTADNTQVDLDSAFDGVWNIVVDNARADRDVLYAAGYGAIMRSIDGGASWQKVLGDPANKSFCTDIEITSTGVLYAYMSSAGSNGSSVPSTAGVWRSADGINWTRISPANWPGQTVRMKIAIAPSNENVLYIAGEVHGNPSDHGIWKYTYKSGNGSSMGGTWEDRSLSLPTSSAPALEVVNTLGGYAVALAVHPSDPETVFFGGTDVYRSPNGFADPQSIEWVGGYNPDPNGEQSYPDHHPDNHDFTFSNSHPDRMYNCNDAGVFVSDDSRSTTGGDPYHPITWTNLNFRLRASISYVAGIDHAGSDSLIVAGFQDQGAWMGRPGELWDQYTGGDGCYVAMADNKTAIYTSSQFATMYRLRVTPELVLNSYSFISPRFTNPQFVAPWILDPVDNRQMFVGDSNQLWWNSNLDSIPDDNYYYTNVNWSVLTQCTIFRKAVISALAVSRVPAHHVFYGTSDGHVYTIASTSTPPVELTASVFPKNAFVSCISVDPDDASHLIVCFSNYHVRSLFASDDGGKTWRDISGNLEQYSDGSGDGPSTRWVSIVHRSAQTVYLVGTSVGLYSTSDISSNVTWKHESPNDLGRTIVEHLDVRQSDGFVAVATQGSGIWHGTVFVDTNSAAVRSFSHEELQLWPNPVRSELHYSGSMTSAVTVFDATGRAIPVSMRTSGVLDCSRLPSGTYTLSIGTGGAEERRRFVVRR